jgi:hypothetical protein
VANGIAPDTVPGQHRPGRRRNQWLGLAVIVAGIAAVAIVVPPLITPHHHASPPAAAASAVPSAVAQPSSAAPSSSPAARFTPITVEAEDPHNTLIGGAAPTDCATCRGGGRVRYICITCRVIVRTSVAVAGPRTVTVYYEADGPRSLKVSVNDAQPRRWPVTGTGWETPRSFRFTADLPAGPVRLTLFNDESPAPDVDEVVIS